MRHFPTRARQIDGAVNGLEVDNYGTAKKPTWAWFQGVKTVVAEIQDLAFMRLLDKQTKVSEVFGIQTNGKSKAEIKKEISRRKTRPSPHGKK